jgi:hypothetical protein
MNRYALCGFYEVQRILFFQLASAGWQVETDLIARRENAPLLAFS